MDGQPWRWKGVSAFALLDRFAKGEDIEPFLLDVAGYNVLRVFGYVPVKDWGDHAWDWPAADVVPSFCAFVARYGFLTELVLLTDDDPSRVAEARHQVAALDDAHVATVVLEAGNEPTSHKAINTRALKPILETSGYVYSSGDYEDSSRFFGSYGTFHSARDGEWVRRAHDALEYYNGGGPNAPTDPAHRVPWVADEPIRPDQATGNREQDFLAYYATCALLGAGATYHCESGKLATLFTEDERRFAAIALQGLDAFPADAPNGAYQREDEGPRTLRTYHVGPYTVRIRPTDGRVLP